MYRFVVDCGFGRTRRNFLILTALIIARLLFQRAHGQDWQKTSEVPTANFTALASSADGQKLVALPSSEWILTSTNSGASWAALISPNRIWNAVASSADGTKLVVVGPGISVSTNSGATWAGTSSPNYDWSSVASSADGTKLAVAAGYGPIFTSSDSGTTWLPSGAPNTRSWNSLASSADGTKLIAAPEYGPIYISTDSGANWTQTSLPLGGPVASSGDGNILVAAEWGAGIYVSTNAGATWVQTSAPTSAHWTSVATSLRGRKLMAVGFDGNYVSTDAGATWTMTSSPAGLDWQAVAAASDGNKFVAAAADGVYSWQATPAPFLRITPVSKGTLISWSIPSMNFVLQESSGLDASGWTNVITPTSLNFTTLRYEVSAPTSTNLRLYRLVAIPGDGSTFSTFPSTP